VSSPSSPTCTHDLGAGTTVCLRCRQEARDAARARQQVVLAKLGLAAAGLFGVYIVGGSIINAWRAASRVDALFETPAVVATGRTTSDVRPQGEPKITVPVSAVSAVAPSPAPSAALASAPVTPPATTRVPDGTSAPFALVISRGLTQLKDSVVAERVGDSVTVDFDLVMMRTRRRDKFERIVRATLPAVYGARADSLLAAIPEGSLIGEGDLLTELPLRGIHLPLGAGYQLTLWPETRPGRDGPLVVSYRARVVKG
jgi:hypothetical protein